MPLLKPGDYVCEKRKSHTTLLYANNITIQPGETQSILLKAEHKENIGPVFLDPPKQAVLQFHTTALTIPQDSSTALRVTNVTELPIKITKDNIFGKAQNMRTHGTKSLNPLQEQYPPEADWETRLPNKPKSKEEFLNQLELSGCALTPTNKERLKEVIVNNAEAFFNHDGKLGKFTGPIRHKIERRSDVDLATTRAYRVPLGKREEVERQVNELLEQGVIEHSVSNYTSPIVLVRKKDLSFRFTVDYRSLNAATKKQKYIIPTTTEIIDLAAGANYFTSLDLAQGFFQIELEKEARPLTAFATHEGLCQFRRMPMGLCAAPHTFQSVVRHVQTTIDANLFVYLDDLLLTSETEEQHIQDVHKLLTTLAKFGLKAKLEKCKFGQREVEFLGLIVGTNGVRPNPKKVRAIQELPPPNNTTALRSFLGATNYFRRFIKDYATIATPLYELTKNDKEYHWAERQQQAFEGLRKALMSAPVMIGPIPDRPFRIESDASCIAIGAVLLQQKTDDEPFQAIAYASRKLTDTERRYAALETEALGIVFALSEFRTYILGTPTLLVTDHKPLTSLMHRRDLLGRLAKFQMIIAEYDITIEYRPGKLNAVPDTLSRYLQDEQRDPRPLKPTTDTVEELVNTISAS